MRTYKQIRKALSKLGTDWTGVESVAFIRDEPYAFPDRSLTVEEIQSDTAFLEAWLKAMELHKAGEAKLTKLFPNIGPILHNLGEGTLLADSLKDKEYTVDFEPGLYDIKAVLSHIRRFVKGKKKPDLAKVDFSPYRWTTPLVALTWSRQQGQYINAQPICDINGTALTVVDKRTTTDPSYTLPGLVLDHWNGQPVGTVTGEQYLKLLPAIQMGTRGFHFMYTNCVWDESLAPHFDKSEAMLQEFRSMLKLLPQVTIYAAVPCKLRYAGFAGENQKGYTRRIDEPYMGNENTLIYDGVAWILLLAIDGAPVPGRVAVAEDGRFIVSEWCFREISYATAGRLGTSPDMYSGTANSHTLLTWCAGPLLDRFVQELGREDAALFKMQAVGQVKNKTRSALYNLLLNLIKEGKLPAKSYSDWAALHAKGEITYPLAFLGNEALYYCIKPKEGIYYGEEGKLVGFKATHAYGGGTDDVYTYRYTQDVMIRYYPKTWVVPLYLARALLGIEEPKVVEALTEKQDAALKALPTEDEAMIQEIPVPGAEPVFIGPAVLPPVFSPGGPNAFPLQEPESVPPVPQEAP
jgi:hypothetical protein